jgi:hypothetical protein
MKKLIVAIAGLSTALAGRAWAQPDPPPPPAGTVVRSWNEIAIDIVRIKANSDAQAARAYAMLNAAMYDAVWGILSTFAGARAPALVSHSGAPSNGDIWAAAANAANTVLAGLYPDQTARFSAQLSADMAAAPGGATQKLAGQNWGNQVGSQVLSARSADGSSPNEVQTAGSGPGQFRTSWSGTQFRNLTPFAIASSSSYLGAGPPALTSVDYAAAYNEVRLLGNNAIPDSAKLNQFQFWNLASGTSQPAGAWLQIALVVTNARPQTLPEMIHLFALLSMAMADTVAPTYMTKFTYRHWRPTTAILEGESDGNPNTPGDPSWTSRAASVGGTPEYWSGHSTFSAAAGAILAGFFCRDDIAFSFTSDSAPTPPGTARSYSSFSAAVDDAGRSRIVGGLHFEFSNRDALAAGRGVAREILAGKLLRVSGATHFGSCPL